MPLWGLIVFTLQLAYTLSYCIVYYYSHACFYEFSINNFFREAFSNWFNIKAPWVMEFFRIFFLF